MKDQLLIVVDALLQAKAEIHVHYERRVKNAPRTLRRLEAILFDPKVDEAMGLLVPGIDAPSLVPDEQEHKTESA